MDDWDIQKSEYADRDGICFCVTMILTKNLARSLGIGVVRFLLGPVLEEPKGFRMETSLRVLHVVHGFVSYHRELKEISSEINPANP